MTYSILLLHIWTLYVIANAIISLLIAIIVHVHLHDISSNDVYLRHINNLFKNVTSSLNQHDMGFFIKYYWLLCVSRNAIDWLLTGRLPPIKYCGCLLSTASVVRKHRLGSKNGNFHLIPQGHQFPFDVQTDSSL